MEDRELAALLNNLESDRVKRKSSTSDGKKMRQAICAFANDLPNHKKPGVLFIGINISVASDITSTAHEIQQPDYPIEALQQLTRNAVMHRSYEQTNAPVKVYWFSDRIEISNPGGLFGQVNQENFGRGATDYRNPHLAGVMKDLGYVQRFGYGIPTAKRTLEKNGNPPPEFLLDDTYTSVVVRRRT